MYTSRFRPAHQTAPNSILENQAQHISVVLSHHIPPSRASTCDVAFRSCPPHPSQMSATGWAANACHGSAHHHACCTDHDHTISNGSLKVPKGVGLCILLRSWDLFLWMGTTLSTLRSAKSSDRIGSNKHITPSSTRSIQHSSQVTGRRIFFATSSMRKVPVTWGQIIVFYSQGDGTQ